MTDSKPLAEQQVPWGRQSDRVSYPVVSVAYRVAVRLSRDGNQVTLAVTYQTGRCLQIVETVHFEAPAKSRLRRHAERWWADRSDSPCPTDAVEAFQLASAGGLAKPIAVTVGSSTDHDRGQVVNAIFGDRGPSRGRPPIGSHLATQKSRSRCPLWIWSSQETGQ